MNAQTPLKTWPERAEKFAHDRARIRQILANSMLPLNMAEIYRRFKENFRYLPDIERRMRELIKSGDVKRNDGSISTYELV